MLRSKRRSPRDLIGPGVIGILAVSIIVTFVTAVALTPDSGAGAKDAQGEPSQLVVGVTSMTLNMITTNRFEVDRITIVADTDVDIVANNIDGSTPHNLAIYDSQEAYLTGSTDAALYTTPVCATCKESLVVNLPAGQYFFQCDVHPDTMIGILTAQPDTTANTPTDQ